MSSFPSREAARVRTPPKCNGHRAATDSRTGDRSAEAAVSPGTVRPLPFFFNGLGSWSRPSFFMRSSATRQLIAWSCPVRLHANLLGYSRHTHRRRVFQSCDLRGVDTGVCRLLFLRFAK